MILSIRKDDGTEIWNTKSFSNNPPDFPPHGFDLVFKFPKESESIAISDSGTYVLVVSVNLHDVE